MRIGTTKAAILVESRKPLVIDEIALPERLDVGQVLVRVLYSTICGAQLNEIAAAKGPDRFLPHLLGHEASAIVIDIGPGVTNVARDDTVVLHWRPSRGIQSPTPAYRSIDLYYPDYASASEAVTTPEAGAFFEAMARLSTGGVRVLFSDIEVPQA